MLGAFYLGQNYLGQGYAGTNTFTQPTDPKVKPNVLQIYLPVKGRIDPAIGRATIYKQ